MIIQMSRENCLFDKHFLWICMLNFRKNKTDNTQSHYIIKRSSLIMAYEIYTQIFTRNHKKYSNSKNKKYTIYLAKNFH